MTPRDAALPILAIVHFPVNSVTFFSVLLLVPKNCNYRSTLVVSVLCTYAFMSAYQNCIKFVLFLTVLSTVYCSLLMYSNLMSILLPLCPLCYPQIG